MKSKPACGAGIKYYILVKHKIIKIIKSEKQRRCYKCDRYSNDTITFL